MKNFKIIYTVIAILAIALVGLIFLQFYWLDLARSVNEERFRQNVNDALAEVVKKLEKYEALQVVSQRYPSEQDTVSTSRMNIDSSGVLHYQQQLIIREKKRVASQNMYDVGQYFEVEEETRIDRRGTAKHGEIPRFTTESKLPKNKYQLLQYTGQDSFQYNLDPIQSLKFVYKRGIMQDVIKDMMNILANEPQSIDQRIDPGLLDSLLRLELKYRGIEQPFEMGIKQKKNNDSIPDYGFVSDSILANTIFKSSFSINLFPNDIYPIEENKLYLYFPSKSISSSSSLRVVMMASVVFITLIILSFIFSVTTIFRQKKLSEITKDFISNLTHELKTPISTVSLATEALLDPDIRALNRQAERYLSVIKEENNRLALQVEKVLQIARLDRGDFQLKIQQVDLNKLIHSCAKHIKLPIETREGTLNINLDESRPALIEADEHQLSNIINNLLENANKYSPENPEITVSTVLMERGVKIMVADKGQGIPKDMQKKIFDKFFRVPTGNIHNVKGFGLGLSYVKTMVDAHKGDISVRSEQGKGSTFTIFIPYKYEQY